MDTDKGCTGYNVEFEEDEDHVEFDVDEANERWIFLG